MFIQNSFPQLTITDSNVSFRNFRLNDRATDFIQNCVTSLVPKGYQKVAKNFLKEFFFASLLAGHIKLPGTDYVLVDVHQNSLLQNKVGIIGRMPISKLAQNEKAITFDDWALFAQKLLGNSDEIIKSIITTDPNFETTVVIKNKDWTELLSPANNFEDFTEKFIDAYKKRTKDLQSEFIFHGFNKPTTAGQVITEKIKNFLNIPGPATQS